MRMLDDFDFPDLEEEGLLDHFHETTEQAPPDLNLLIPQTIEKVAKMLYPPAWRPGFRGVNGMDPTQVRNATRFRAAGIVAVVPKGLLQYQGEKETEQAQKATKQ